VKLVKAIDPNRPSLELVCNTVRTIDIGGEKPRGETVHGVIGGRNDFLLRVEDAHDDDGAKYLLLDDLHVGGDVGEDGLESR